MYQRLLKMALDQLQFLEQQIGQLDEELATLLHPHQDAVQRLAEVPGLGVGFSANTPLPKSAALQRGEFPLRKCLSSWLVVPALAPRRERRRETTATDLRRATATCGAFSTKRPTRQRGRKEASSTSSIAAQSRAWNIIKPSVLLPIDSAA